MPDKSPDESYCSKPSVALKGEISIPGDKSISHRALMLAAIAQGQSLLRRPLLGADNQATLNALQQLGVPITVHADEVLVQGVGLYGLRASKGPLDLGNSGTGMRLLAGLLAGQSFGSILTGDASLCRRPMARITQPLAAMGAHIEATALGTAPLHIYGGRKLHAITYRMPIASAQVKSCLLLAGLYAEGVTKIIEKTKGRDHTERLLKGFGYFVQVQQSVVSLSGQEKLQGREIDIPGDISSAAFFMVAATVIPGSDILLKNVGVNPTRTGIITILQAMGANIDIIQPREICCEPVADLRVRFAKLHGIAIPDALIPLAIDEFPVLFIAAACAQGTTILRNAAELRVKESDRLATMAAGLTALGIHNQLLADGIIIEGGQLQGGVVDSYDDHRISMAFAIAGAKAADPVIIRNCTNVATSFPDFIQCAQKIGLNIHYEKLAASDHY